jgi:hypothetical protein
MSALVELLIAGCRTLPELLQARAPTIAKREVEPIPAAPTDATAQAAVGIRSTTSVQRGRSCPQAHRGARETSSRSLTCIGPIHRGLDKHCDGASVVAHQSTCVPAKRSKKESDSSARWAAEGGGETPELADPDRYRPDRLPMRQLLAGGTEGQAFLGALTGGFRRREGRSGAGNHSEALTVEPHT